jgi:hypothetical protein
MTEPNKIEKIPGENLEDVEKLPGNPQEGIVERVKVERAETLPDPEVFAQGKIEAINQEVAQLEQEGRQGVESASVSVKLEPAQVQQVQKEMGIIETVDQIIKNVENLARDAKNDIEQSLRDVERAVGGFVEGVKRDVKQSAEDVKRGTKEFMEGVAEGIKQNMKDVEKGIEDLGGALGLSVTKEGPSAKVYSKKESADTTKKIKSDERPEYKNLKEYLKREQRELSAPVIQEARMKRNEILEARGLLQMSKADFDAYFASNKFDIRADLKQQNVGDCYAVAAIHAMSSSPHFEMICRSSMKRQPDGSWEVRIPLLSEDGQVITITPEELLPQKNRQFLRRNKGDIIPDLRRKLMPVRGKEGLQVLEAAFIKQKFGSVDRLAAEGGWGDEVLLALGGESFEKYKLNAAKYNKDKEKWECPGLSSLSEKDMAYLDHYLENFDPEIHIATVSTKHMDVSTLTGAVADTLGFYKGKGTLKVFVPGHAYSISKVNPENKTVTLANPWNTSKPIELTFDQFKENFSGFEAVRINSAKLLKNMGRIEKRAA